MFELQQRPKFDIFQKALFCTLVSSANLVLNAVPKAVGQLTKLTCIFKEAKTKRKTFRQSCTKQLKNISRFETTSLHGNGTSLSSSETEYTSCLTSC